MNKWKEYLQRKNNPAFQRKLKYGMRKLSIGLVSCLLGYAALLLPQGVNAEKVKPEAAPQAITSSQDQPVDDLELGEEPTVQPVRAAEPDKAPTEYKSGVANEDEKQIQDFNKDTRYRVSEVTGDDGTDDHISKAKLNFGTGDVGKTLEGLRVEVLNPSPTTKDKLTFGVELIIDKKGAQRTYNGFYITDTRRGAPIDAEAHEFLAPSQTLPGFPDEEVTYKPSDKMSVKLGRQTTINYAASDADREELAKPENEKMVIVWKGKYRSDKPDPNEKILQGGNFGVGVGINPYPNENKYLQVIKVSGNTVVAKVPVQNQYVVTGAKIDNLGEEDYDRIVGEVYHPGEDVLVKGAEALVVTPGNLDDLKAKTKNNDLQPGQIIIKMPQGALQDKNSPFNDVKFRGLQNLRAKFFARPRTKAEFTALAEALDDESLVYTSTSAGEATIKHKGQDVTIDKQGIDRYDHYNLVGGLTINLDDTLYYNHNFDKLERKDGDQNYLEPGKTGTIALKPVQDKNHYDKDTDQMKEHKAKEEVKAEIDPMFLKSAEAKGWKISLGDDISSIQVTAPEDAKPGDYISIPLRYTYTNGSTDEYSFPFVVKEKPIKIPSYHAEAGFQGDVLTNKPELPDKKDYEAPTSYELVGDTFTDDKGNVWTDVKVDPTTGVVSATVPEGVEIVGEENLYVPVKATYPNGEIETVKAQFIARPKTKGELVDEDKIPYGYKVEFDPDFYEKYPDAKENYKVVEPGKEGTNKKTWKIENSKIVGEPTIERTEPVDAVIKVGQKDYTGEVSHEVTEELPFTVKIVEDADLPAGQTEIVQEGVKGSKTTKYTQQIKNGKADGDLASAVVSETPAKEQIIRVGKKPANNNKEVAKEVPVEIEYVPDPDLDVTIAKAGELIPGKVTTVVTNEYNPKTGKIETKEKTEVTPAKQKIIVGTKKYTGKFENNFIKEIPFETEIVFDDTLAAGEQVVDKPGKVGEKIETVVQEFKNGQQVNVTVKDTDTKAPENRVIRVGSKTEGEHSYTEKIPFGYRVEYDPTMEAGTHKIVNAGKEGERTTIWKIKNSKIQEKPLVTETAPVDAVIHVGSKDFTGSFTTVEKKPIPFEVEYKIDPSLKPGEEVVDQEGESGEEETSTLHKITNGNVVESTSDAPVQKKAPVKKIVRIGAKTDGSYTHKEEIPFEVEVRKVKDLKKGESRVAQQGVAGEKVTTVTIENSVVQADPKVEVTKEPVKHIIEVGDEDFTGEVSHKVKEELPFEVEVIEDPTLLAGKQVVDQQGEKGSKTVTYTQAIKNGEADGNLKAEVTSKTEPKKHIVRVGIKPVEGTETPINKEVPVEIEYVFDENLEKGKVETGKLTPGKTETKVVSKVVDGKVVNTEETVVTPAKQIVRVGSKDFTGEFKYSTTCPIPYTVEVKENPDLLVGEHKVIQEGKAGSKTTNYAQAIKNGQAEGAPTVTEGPTTEPIKHIIEVGTKQVEGNTETTNDNVPVEVEYVYDDSMEKGKVETGKLTPGNVSYKIENKVVDGKVVTVKTPVVTPAKQIIKVGSKDFTGEYKYTTKCPIPYTVEIRENPNLEAGKKKVVQEGKAGEQVTTYIQKLKNGQADGAPTVEAGESKEATPMIIEVGTKQPVCKPGEKPADPEKPGEKPADPEKPGEKPADPEKPGEKPADPEKPGEKPADPEKPGEKPGDPEKPGEKPADPEKPGEKPADPEKPGGKPGDPEKPGEKPGNPEKPGEKPGDSENTGKQPQNPEKPGKQPGSQSKAESTKKAQDEAPRTSDPGILQALGASGLASVAFVSLKARKRKEDR